MRLLRVFGKLLISVGMGVLMFVGWTLWGTGFYNDRQQDELRDQFAGAPDTPPDKNGPSGPPKGFAPGPGRPVFNLVAPTIDLDQIVVEGVGVEELKRGPGHYPACRSGFLKPLCTEFDEIWPGEKGRVIVSGHRTTYGQPFWDLDKLRPGDKVMAKTKWGDFTYEVTKTEIVPPDSLAIAVPSDRAEIVLTTCNPKFSAAERLVVFARMVTTA